MGQKYMKQLFQILNKRSVIQKRKETNKVSPGGTVLAMVQRGRTQGNHGGISELRKLSS